jgi:hypothetical protein
MAIVYTSVIYRYTILTDFSSSGFMAAADAAAAAKQL